MAYDISWYIENRVLHSYWSGTVTPAELNASRYASEPYLAACDRSQVHTIIDMSGVSDFRVGVYQIKEEALPKGDLAPVGGWMLYVGVGRIIKALVQIGARVAGMKTRTFDTLPEALAFLAEIDPSLAGPLADKQAGA